MSTATRIVRITAVTAVGALGALLPLGVAGAYPNPPNPPSVSPANEAKAPAQVEANQTSRASTLPFTGTDVAELVAIGGASIGVGAVLVRRSRRVRTS